MTINLLKNYVHIWSIDLEQLSLKDIHHLIELLSKEELEKSNSFKTENSKFCSLVSRIALRQIISCYKGLSPKQIIFSSNNYGKPTIHTIQNNDVLHFNLSHTDKNIVIALCCNPIGIDIESVNHTFDIFEVVNDVLCENERHNFYRTSPKDREQQFYKIWTQKEAILKAMGIGITKYLKELDTSDVSSYPEWKVSSFNTFNQSLIGHVAYKSKVDASIKYYFWPSQMIKFY